MSEVKLCLTCKHWGGNKVRAAEAIETYGLRVVAPDTCSVSAGACLEIRYDGVEIEIGGDGWLGAFETEPWFGCVKWEKAND